MIEKIASLISENVSRELGYDEEKKAVVQYGTYALIQTLISIFTVFIVGLILGVTLEALVFLFTVSILRKYSGGAHSDSSNICTMLGIIMSSLAGLLVNLKLLNNININWIIGFIVVIFGMAYYIILKYAPVDTPNKRIKTDKKRKRMLNESLKILTIYLFIVLCGAIVYYNFNLGIAKSIIMSLLFGVIWQCITLTSMGELLLNSLDSFIHKLL